MRLSVALSTSGLLLLLAAPCLAQEHQVTRRVFTFLNNDLAIEVAADAPGVLRLARGSLGLLEVAARAPRGLAGFGLAGGGEDRLTLTAVGDGEVDYVVMVPPEVRVRIRLPDRPLDEQFSTFERVATYRWAADAEAPEPAGAAAPRPRSGGAAGGGLDLAYVGAQPGVVSIADAALVRTLTVRWEGAEFRVSASRPLEVARPATGVLELRSAGPPVDLVVAVPRQASEFVLRVGGSPALVLERGQAAALCSPVMDQRLDDGRRWFTFTPHDGRLDCRPRVDPGRRRVGP